MRELRWQYRRLAAATTAHFVSSGENCRQQVMRRTLPGTCAQELYRLNPTGCMLCF